MKTLVITGGTGSLGSAVVPRLERDYRCVLLRRDDDAGRVIAAAAPVYALVHLAGGFAAAQVAESDDAAWTSMISSNLMSFVSAARAAIPHLERGGRIVAISSHATIGKPAGLGPYVASKSALNATIEVLAKELKKSGVSVNALLPDTLQSGGAAGVPLANVAEAIAWLLSAQASNITGALIPMSA
ncbi:MAG: SDR family NAD(P)-dependent oxidoreductase [Thermoanaerobaculia bacterium]